MGELVLVDGLPEARGGRVHGGRLEHGGCHAICERTVDKVAKEDVSSMFNEKCKYLRVTSNPAQVGHTAESVLGMHVEHVLDSHSCSEKESANSVHDPLGLSCRSRSLWEHLAL